MQLRTFENRGILSVMKSLIALTALVPLFSPSPSFAIEGGATSGGGNAALSLCIQTTIQENVVTDMQPYSVLLLSERCKITPAQAIFILERVLSGQATVTDVVGVFHEHF